MSNREVHIAYIRRSGIGRKGLLESLDIPVKVDLAEVGENYRGEQDLNVSIYVHDMQLIFHRPQCSLPAILRGG